MADIAIIYASEDREVARGLSVLFAEQGWTVWWDHHIKQGAYRRQIEQALRSAKAVVPIWSKHSVEKSWVIDEAEFAVKDHKPLFPVRLGDVNPPLGLGQLQSVIFAGSECDPTGPAARQLLEMLEGVVGQRRGADTKPLLVVNAKRMSLPVFVRSVSSHETFLSVRDAVSVLNTLRPEAVLLSAYDLKHEARRDHLLSVVEDLKQSPTVVMLDSGNYEKSRKKTKWTWNEFVGIARSTDVDLVLGFDNLEPPSSKRDIVDDVVTKTLRDRKACRTRNICPIVHLPSDESGRFRTELAPDVCFAIASRLSPPLLAIPERELGDGVIERAKTVAAVRTRLNRLPGYQPLHLLGTGNPISMAVFVAAGADVFDGLEWCRTVMDNESKGLFHHQHLDLFGWQDEWISDATRRMFSDSRMPYRARLAVHNLECFRDWCDNVRSHAAERRLDVLLARTLPKSFDKLRAALPGVFA